MWPILYCGLLAHVVMAQTATIPVNERPFCLQGLNSAQTDLKLTCPSGQYIQIQKVTHGVTALGVCKNDSADDICCPSNTTDRDFCLYSNMDSLSCRCTGQNSCSFPDLVLRKVEGHCDLARYNGMFSFIKVDYTCNDVSVVYCPTSSPAPTTDGGWQPPITTEYPNYLSIGAQAGIIVAIMCGILIIAFAFVIYKRVRDGPPEDFRKLFSKPPPPDDEDVLHMTGYGHSNFATAMNTSKPIPWIPGEAQEEIYKTIVNERRRSSTPMVITDVRRKSSTPKAIVHGHE
ncbi:uncharacterized protein LOC131949339 [Physella acuta]|uniref:uncharacterized protein LOC131949339 n=1 Tax=Physella acuta TaxID=109671 RepID=UPI0027DB64C7|nr:uncharacterized protein LOC131949339 [Physella acuta]